MDNKKGDGAPDLDGSRIYYLGQSLGAMWGMLVFAYEPAIRAAVFNVPAGTLPYNDLLSPVDRPGFGAAAVFGPSGTKCL